MSDPRIAQYLVLTGVRPESRLTPLTPDASDRRYVRVTPLAGPPFVLALYPGALDWAAMPFADAHALFTEMGIPVPRVLGHEDALGIVAQEDLGDVTLQAWLREAADAERDRRYAEAVDLIVAMQIRGRALASTPRLPYRLAFDVEKLMFELRFFAEHFLEGWRGVVLGADERAALEAACLALASRLAAEPRVICHRDYHCRNLMVHTDRLRVIDYQDARMGPDTYDLASLLRDSYVTLPDPLVDAMLARFLAATGRGPADQAQFRERFDIMAVQRNLKALGTFGFQASRRNNPNYVGDMPRTLAYLRVTLAKYPCVNDLRRALAPHLPELA